MPLPKFHIDPAEREPLYLQIAGQVRDAILHGRLEPGEILPGSRTISEQLGLARNTIKAAFEELVTEGFLLPQAGQGYRILEQPAERCVADLAPGREGPSFGFDLPTTPAPARLESVLARFDLREVMPDPRLLPRVELGRALRRALRLPRAAEDPDLEPLGLRPLREALSGFLEERRGVKIHPDQLLVTRGEGQATDLLMRAFLKPGRTVVLESPGLPRLREQAELMGIRIQFLPVDEDGAIIDPLETWDKTIRMIILSPCAQIPTGTVFSPKRRERLLEWAARHRIAIVELDGEGEWAEGSPAPRPLMSEDSHGVVIYLGGLRGLLGPTLRMGWIAGPRSLISRLASLQATLGLRPEPTLEGALRELLEEGTLSRMARKMFQSFQERRGVLEARMGIPHRAASGGALWMPTGDRSGEAWARNVEAAGIRIRPGRDFDPQHRDLPFLRLPFMAHLPEELRQIADCILEHRPADTMP